MPLLFVDTNRHRLLGVAGDQALSYMVCMGRMVFGASADRVSSQVCICPDQGLEPSQAGYGFKTTVKNLAGQKPEAFLSINLAGRQST